MGLFDGAVDTVSGWFGWGSEARQKARKYEALEKVLGEKLDKANEYYSDAETALNEVHNSLTGGPGEAEGNIMTDFTDKESSWSGEYKSALMAMQNAIKILSQRKAEAGELKTYWEMQAEIEETKGKG
ncbi:MAG: hypothetical protein K2K21_04875 [Lachnospiraceae bacterium]|nr:hypothetical protein [Lachnospiraceae bacterium]